MSLIPRSINEPILKWFVTTPDCNYVVLVHGSILDRVEGGGKNIGKV